jgi:hypothetical protein
MKFCLHLIAMLLCTTTLAQGSKTIHLATAGTLKDGLTATEKTTVAVLTVTGSIDARDVQFMRDSMTALVELDLEGAHVVAYEGAAGTIKGKVAGTIKGKYATYPANEMPQVSFFDPRWYTDKISLASVKLPAGLTSIGEGAFYGCCRLTSLSLPAGLTSIGKMAFFLCSELTGELTLPAGVTSIDDRVFYGCRGLNSLSLPAGLTSIGEQAFAGCSGLAGSLSLPAGVTSIGGAAFSGCRGLTSLSLPAGLTILGIYNFPCFGVPADSTLTGSDAFSGCSGLTSITNHSLRPQAIAGSMFYGVNTSACTLTVPTSAVGLYAAAKGWKNFTSIAGGGIVFAAKANKPALGSVSGTEQGLYASGTAISVTAKPTAGHSFLYWARQSGVQMSTSSTLSFALMRDSVLTAYFE